MRTFKITTFPNVWAETGTPEELTLEDLAARLTSNPSVCLDKRTGACFVPGHFTDNRRSKANFSSVSCLVFDFDGEDHAALTDAELLSVIETTQSLGVAFILHTTYSFCLRVVFPLAADVDMAAYRSLYETTARRYKLQPDEAAFGASRLNFLPQVPRDEDLPRFAADCDLSRPLLGPAGPTSAARTGTIGVFSALKLAKVRVGAVDTLAALTEVLATSTAKQEDLNRYVFALAKSAAARGQDQQEFAAALWPAAEAGLSRNANPVENWNLAVSTCERAVTQAYRKHAEEHAAATAEALAKIPEAKLKRTAKLIDEGKMREAGAVIAGHIAGPVTADVLLRELAVVVDASQGITSVPEALAELQASLEEHAPDDWQARLRFNLNGRGEQYDASEENLAVVFEHHPDCRELFENNVRAVLPHRYRRDAPWGVHAGEPFAGGDTRMFNWIRDELGLRNVKFGPLDMVATRYAESAPEVDPFLDYLKALPAHVGEDTLSTLLVQHFGVEDTDYARAVTRKTLIAACARADRPGCMLDSILVLYSPKGGQGKTKFWAALLPEEHWSGSIKDLNEREVPMKLQRYVFGLVDEVDKWAGKRAAGALKEFLTEQGSTQRAAYARHEKLYQRRGVLVGSTNVEKFTHDPSGARRYWVLEVQRACRFEDVRAQRDSIWAQAWQAYQAGEPWWFSTEEQERLSPELNEVLQVREPTAESEALLELIADASEYTASARASRAAREGKIGLLENQMVRGHYLTFITEMQALDYFQLRGWRSGVDVKHALEACGMRRCGSRRTTRWELPKHLRQTHEAEAIEARARKLSSGGHEQTSVMNMFAVKAQPS